MFVLASVLILCLVQTGSSSGDLHFESPAERLAHPRSTRFTGLGNANVFIDGLVFVAHPLLTVLEPFKLPRLEKHFQKPTPFGLINATGGFSIAGQLGGFSSVHRTGQSTLFSTKDGMKLKTSIGFHNLTLNSSSEAYFGMLNLPFDLFAKIRSINGTAEFSVSLIGLTKPQLTDFVIHDIGKVDLTVAKLGFFNFLVEGAGSLLLNAVKDILKANLAKPLLRAFNQAIAKMSILDLIG